MNREFFAYDPLLPRLLSLALSVCAVVVAAWAAAEAEGSVGPRGWIRTGLSLGLAFAALWLFFKLWPRPGWGVQVGPLALTVARLANGQAEVPWSKVLRVERRGKKRDQLVVVLSGEQCVTVPARLFRRRADFEALAAAVDEKLPPAAHGAQAGDGRPG